MADDLNKTEPSEEGDKRDNVRYWLRWLKGAKKRAKRHFDDARAAWDEYENERLSTEDSGPNEKYPKRYPIYWSSCKILEPAYYSRTPKLDITRDFDISDDVALTASLITERLGKHHLENSHFDSVLQAAVGDFIHADKATTQVIYEMTPQTEMARRELTLISNEDGTTAYMDGDALYDGEAQEDATGAYYEAETIVPTDKRIYLKPVCFDEILHTPEAKSWDEVTDIAYKFCISEEEAKERFPNLKHYPWKFNKSYEEDREDKEREDIPGRFLEGWEIYCSHTGMIYFVCEDYEDDFLDFQPNELGFKFPSPPFAIGSKPRKSLYPTPAFVQAEPLIAQLHKQFQKVVDLIESIRRRALVDASHPELIQMLNADDNDYVAVQNMQSLVEKGGLQNLVWYLPVQDLVQAIVELNGLEDRFKANFFEWFGVPDILRGQSDPLEAQGTQEIKTQAAHDRFKNDKKKIAELAKDSLRMLVELSLNVLNDSEIAEIVGYEYLSPAHQVRFVDALNLLRDPKRRLIRIDIETDSTSFVDDQLKIQKQLALTSSIMQGLSAIGGMQNPEFGGVALQLLLTTVSGLSGSKEYEDGIKEAVGQLMQTRAQPPPPPPDYEKMKLELQAQKQQLDAGAKQRELDQKEYKLMLDGQKQAAENQLATFKAQLDQTLQQFLMVIEGQKLQLEQFKAQSSANESAMEEMRLAREADAKALEAVTKVPEVPAESPAPPTIITVPQPEMPPININLEVSKPGKRVGRIIRDEFGNSTLEVEEVPPVGSLGGIGL